MTTFRVKLGSSDGELAVREVNGASSEEVQAQLAAEGYFVFSIQRKMDMGAYIGVKRSIPPKEFIRFNKEFRGLVRAGLPIAEGFDLILKRMKSGRLRAMLEEDATHLGTSKRVSASSTDSTAHSLLRNASRILT